MADSIRIGRVYGISVELHWTFILLLLFSLIIPIFFIFLLLVFVSVFLHELCHSVTALKNGRKVNKIVLTPLGGASILDDINLDPKLEFRISIVGPISNLLLAGVSGILVVFTPLGAATLWMQYFFLINILLGVSNILPIFPMDGGRIFRSYLERTRNKFDATMITANISKGLLGLMVVGTIAFVIIGTSYSLAYRESVLLWIMLIAFILYGGTQAEVEAEVLRKETAGLTVKGALRKGFIYTAPDRSLSSLYDKIKDAREHIVITRMGDDFFIAELSRARKMRNASIVKDVSVPAPTVSENANVVDALSKMESINSGVAIVLKAQRPVGIVTRQHLQAYASLHVIAIRERKLKKQQPKQESPF